MGQRKNHKYKIYLTFEQCGTQGTNLFCSRKFMYNLQSVLHLCGSSTPAISPLQIQPAADGVVLQYLPLKNNLCISGPAQLILLLFKDQLYFEKNESKNKPHLSQGMQRAKLKQAAIVNNKYQSKIKREQKNHRGTQQMKILLFKKGKKITQLQPYCSRE